MASKPRDFGKDLPVHVANRCVLRINLLQSAAIRKMVKALIARHAPKCRVRVLQYSIRPNHLHLLLSQDFTGHDPEAKVGIAAFCRNVFSGVALYGNGYLGLSGRFWERTYRSCIRGEGEEALQAFAYIAFNAEHHGESKGVDGDDDSGTRVYVEGRPDGVVTHVLGVFAPMEARPDARGAFVRKVLTEWRDLVKEKRDEVAVARKLLCRHAEGLDIRGATREVPLARWLGARAVEQARRELVSWVAPRSQFEARRAPKLGETIDIRVKELLPAPRAGVGWREISE